MTNLEVLRELVMMIDPPTQKDESLKVAIITILNTLEKMHEQQPQPAPEPDQEPEVEKSEVSDAEKPKKRGRKPFDIEKAKACRKAGWSIAKIADEMSVSELTVRKHLKEAGVEVGATIVE